MSVEIQRAVAVVPAAGVGRRMGGTLPKQYLPLADSTVIECTLKVLLDCPLIEHVVVGVGSDDQLWHTLPLFSHASIETVIGGSERAQTVLNCLESLSSQYDNNPWVLVHDAVRPCLQNSDIIRLWKALHDGENGGLLALPLLDTIKRVDNLDCVSATLDRNALWAAQTPQIFRLNRLLAALRAACDKGVVTTDESSAIEAFGLSPKLVTGSVENIKITRPEDLPLAEFYLNSRQQEPSLCQE